MFVPVTGSEIKLDGFRVIVPCISVGNIAQLAVDLLINTLKLGRVGYLDDESLLPLVGNDAFDHTGASGYMHTAGEVYASIEHNTAVVQLRTPIVKGCKSSFCAHLLSWFKTAKFAEVILLTSSYSHERKDVQITSEPFRFLLTPETGDFYTTLNKDNGWSALEPRGDVKSCEKGIEGNGVLLESQLFIPGSGLAKLLYLQSCVEQIRLVMLMTFSSQGDNIHDAIAFAAKIFPLLNMAPKGNDQSWTLPSSWSLMYGNPSPKSIF